MTNDVTLPFLIEINNDIFGGFFMSQLWTMKVTASTNFCYISDRVTCAVEVNIKKNLPWKQWFPANAYVANRLLAEKKRRIT